MSTKDVFFLDIETKPNEQLVDMFKGLYPKAPRGVKDYEAWVRKKMATDTDFCRVVCVCVRHDGVTTTFRNWNAMGQWLWDHCNLRLVTYNGKGFDIPALIKQGLRHGANLPYRWLAAGTHKYNHSKHLDMMLALAYGGKWKSLDTMLQLYCGTQKETLGEAFFATATDEELIKHCEEDMEYTELLYKVFQGVLD